MLGSPLVPKARAREPGSLRQGQLSGQGRDGRLLCAVLRNLEAFVYVARSIRECRRCAEAMAGLRAAYAYGGMHASRWPSTGMQTSACSSESNPRKAPPFGTQCTPLSRRMEVCVPLTVEQPPLLHGCSCCLAFVCVPNTFSKLMQTLFCAQKEITACWQ